MRKLVIDRKVWLRGETESFLLRPEDGKRCCVGIYLSGLGLTDECLADKEAAAQLMCSVPTEAVWLIDDLRGQNSKSAEDLYAINDEEDADESIREKQIRAEFKKRGVAVRFIN